MLPLRWAWRWRAASVTLLVVILIMGVMPMVWFFDNRRSAIDWFEHIDKVAHVGIFFALAVWFCGQYPKKAYWRIAAGLVIYGIVMEFCQRMVGYRTADIYDVAANVSGIAVGLAAGMVGLGGWSLALEQRLVARKNANA